MGINLNQNRSAGKGLGQQTGGSATMDTAEAGKIMSMIDPIDELALADTLSEKEFKFIHDIRVSIAFGSVTGKQLFWLRDIKDKLVDAGVI